MKPKTLMLTTHTPNTRARLLALLLAAAALVAPLSNVTARAQMASVLGPEDALPRKTDAPLFRMEAFPVGRDAELLTVFGSLNGLKDDEGSREQTRAAPGDSEVPLVCILRDTLGDANPENDRLRYVWMLTYTRPTALQRAASAVPFLYEAETGERAAFTLEESNEIQARLMLTGKTFGGLIDDAYLDRALRDQKTKLLDERGHNWELLRQRAETEGLYFEPLEMPDGGT